MKKTNAIIIGILFTLFCITGSDSIYSQNKKKATPVKKEQTKKDSSEKEKSVKENQPQKDNSNKNEKEVKIDKKKSDALAKKLSALNQPKGLDADAKTESIKETPVSEATETSRKQGTTIEGVPVTYITTSQKFKASAAFDQQILLNPSTDVIYPGAVLLGHTIASGTYQEVSKGTKNPITISYDLTNIKKGKNKDGNERAGKVTGTIVPNLANYRALHNKIMGQDLGKASTISSFEQTSIYSEQDFGIKFNFGVGFNGAGFETKIKTGFSFGKGSKKNKYMIKFMETFYTVDVNQGQDTFLYKDFNVADFKGYRPVYVASIAYGRLAYLTIESDESWENIKTDLEASVNTTLYGNYDGSVEATVNKLTKNNKINIVMIGANSVAIDLKSFIKELQNGGFSKNNSGKIIAYKLRFVDDNSIANTVYNDEYTVVKTEEQLGKGIETTFTLYKIKTNSKDKGGKGLELYGNLELSDGKVSKSMWSTPRKYFKKLKDRGETSENGMAQYTVPNDNATFNLTLTLKDKNSGAEKNDAVYTNAVGEIDGGRAMILISSNYPDGKEIVIRAYNTKVVKKQRQKIDSEWVEFYIRVNKKFLY